LSQVSGSLSGRNGLLVDSRSSGTQLFRNRGKLSKSGSRLDNFTSAREHSIMVVILQQLKWSYQFEPSDKAAACLCALPLRTQHCFHGKNRPITCPESEWSPPVYVL